MYVVWAVHKSYHYVGLWLVFKRIAHALDQILVSKWFVLGAPIRRGSHNYIVKLI